MRVACLFDGTAWALVMPEHLYALGAVRSASSEATHAALLAAYLDGQPCLQAVPDDGYIMQVRAPALVLRMPSQPPCGCCCCNGGRPPGSPVHVAATVHVT
jgi:hypothetical protein